MVKSGVYRIQNIINGKIYIGSSINLEKRKCRHFKELTENIHSNKHLQAAYNKYGKNAFVFEIIEEIQDINLLTSVEQSYINKYNFDTQLYNLCPNAGSWLGKKHTESSKEKMRLNGIGRVLSSDAKEKIRKKNLGRKHTENSKEKIRNAKINKLLGNKHNKNLAEIGRKAAIKRRKPIYQLDKNTLEIIAEWESIYKVRLILGYNDTVIGAVCRGKHKTAYGFVWKYKESCEIKTL